jgi:hypothetical protein
MEIPYINTVDEVDTYDQYIGTQVRVKIGDYICTGMVVRPKRELDGTVRG